MIALMFDLSSHLYRLVGRSVGRLADQVFPKIGCFCPVVLHVPWNSEPVAVVVVVTVVACPFCLQ